MQEMVYAAGAAPAEPELSSEHKKNGGPDRHRCASALERAAYRDVTCQVRSAENSTGLAADIFFGLHTAPPVISIANLQCAIGATNCARKTPILVSMTRSPPVQRTNRAKVSC
jgi:hypothetical protein